MERYIYSIDPNIFQEISGLSDVVSEVLMAEMTGTSISDTFITGEGVNLLAACLLFSKSNISLGNDIFIAKGGEQRHTHCGKITCRSKIFKLFRSPDGVYQAYCRFAWILRQDRREDFGNKYCFKRVFLSNRADKLIPGVYILFFAYDGAVQAKLVYIPTEGYNEDCLKSTMNFLKNGERENDIRILHNMENHFVELLNE